MSEFLHKPWFFGLFVVSFAFGIVGSFLFFLFLRWLTGAQGENIFTRSFLYTGFFTGVVERFFFTMIIGVLGFNGIAQAIVTWIAIKGQVHYQMFSGTREHPADLARAYLALLGSIGSAIFAILGGYLWTEDWSLDNYADKLNHVLFLLDNQRIR
jgi:hypothetical protein